MEWIDCKERLPDCQNKKWGIDVLAFIITDYGDGSNKRYRIVITPFSKGKFYNRYVAPENEYPRHNDTISHWMELPKRPKPQSK